MKERKNPSFRVQTDFFYKKGPLSQVLPGYEFRPQQARIMTAVQQAISQEDCCLIEAGTGVGKTMAYLVPALSSGNPVVVATGTKTLMEQIYHKDVPLLQEALPFSFEAVMLKGRSNYLCLRRLRDNVDATLLKEPSFGTVLLDLRRWASKTTTGDFAELQGYRENHPVLRRFASRTDDCMGRRCPQADRCFVMAARAKARAADLVITNHHLFFIEVAGAETSTMFSPDATLIIDEAHRIEGVATEFLGHTVSSTRILELVQNAQFLAEGSPDKRLLLATLPEVQEHFTALITALQPSPGSKRILEEDLTLSVIKTWHRMDQALEIIENESRQLADNKGIPPDLSGRVKQMRATMATILDQEEEGWIRLVNTATQEKTLQALPLDVSGPLRQRLFLGGRPVILVSATLSVEGNMDLIRQRLGVPQGCPELLVQSPYDYTRQALLYLPKTMPHPNDPTYIKALVTEILSIIQTTQGKALVLFTSHAAMRNACEQIRPQCPYPILLQRDMPRDAMLQRFRQEKNTCLFGTATFWEGVDIVGEALSAVIIDRLPFDAPDDPLLAARVELIRKQGQDPFESYQVPLAVIRLRQGFGRLIRHRKDRGIIAILDPRIQTQKYGPVFLRSLPKIRIIDKLPSAPVEPQI